MNFDISPYATEDTSYIFFLILLFIQYYTCFSFMSEQHNKCLQGTYENVTQVKHIDLIINNFNVRIITSSIKCLTMSYMFLYDVISCLQRLRNPKRGVLT